MARKKKVVKEKIIKKVSLIKKAYNTIKSWVISNGVEGIAGVILGAILWVTGFKVYAGFALGVFATRNWDIVKTWLLKLLKK